MKLILTLSTKTNRILQSVADPGFPVGGGAADLRRGYFLAKTYAKTKELDPVGGGGRQRRPLDPPMPIVNSRSPKICCTVRNNTPYTIRRLPLE